MKNKLYLAIAVLTTLFTSCQENPISVKETDNSHFRVEYLFTIDSCKVYRFHDGDRLQYIVVGPNTHQIQLSH